MCVIVVGLTTGMFYGSLRVAVYRFITIHCIRPPLNIKLFPFHRPIGLIRADWILI